MFVDFDKDFAKSKHSTSSTYHEKTIFSIPLFQGFGIVLFIQMELCDITLRQWLRERNHDIAKNGMLEYHVY